MNEAIKGMIERQQRCTLCNQAKGRQVKIFGTLHYLCDMCRWFYDLVDYRTGTNEKGALK